MLEFVIVLNRTRFTAEKIAVDDFNKQYLRRVTTPDGLASEYEYDESSGDLYKWNNGRREIHLSNVPKAFARLNLLEWAMYEAEHHNNDDILVFRNKDEVIEYIRDCFEIADDNVEKLNALIEEIHLM